MSDLFDPSNLQLCDVLLYRSDSWVSWAIGGGLKNTFDFGREVALDAGWRRCWDKRIA